MNFDTFFFFFFFITVNVSRFWGAALGDTGAVLHNNGYEGVVVAIGEDVPENPRIVENLKRMFENASSVLHEATRYRAHFSEVKIVVPSTWSPSSRYLPTKSSGRLSEADVRVDLPHPTHGDSPYTLQLGGCGDRGAYIHLSHTYAAAMFDELQHVYGPPGKVLVHEWAHLRWGVFDEYGEHGTPSPPFYIGDDLHVHATGCTEEMKGWLRTSNGEPCRVDTRGLPDEECHFFPAPGNNTSASLMNLYFLDSVSQFCDNDSFAHNSRAPNAQNLHCDGRSVWEVITQHEDFKDDANPPRSNLSLEDLKPQIQVIQEAPQEKPRFIMLLDLSGSMEPHMTQFYQAVVNFVRDLVPNGSQMAVVSFANTSHLDLDFTVVSNHNREDIVKALPYEFIPGGLTAIGGSLEYVIQLVERQSIKSEGLKIILITDGEESMYPLVASKLPFIKQMGIVINTISFGPYATDSLETWAKETGGKSHHYSPGSRSLDSLLFHSIITDEAQRREQLLQVQRVLLKVNASSFVSDEVILDRSLGHETRFTFSETITQYNRFSTRVKLLSPDGTIYDEETNSGIRQVDNKTQTIIFKILDAKAGRWRYNVSNVSPNLYRIPPDEVLVAVTSYPSKKAKDEPIRVKTWMSVSNVTYPAPCVVYAYVSQGYSAIINADVTAIIERPTQDPVHLSLLDNGVGADFLAGDGLYAAYFTQFSGNGRYSVSAVTSTTNNTAKLQGLAPTMPGVNAIRQYELPIPEEKLPAPDSKFSPDDFEPSTLTGGGGRIPNALEKVPVEDFTRYTSGGIFKVQNFEATDMQPPSRIIDLEVATLSLFEATVTLTFTSPGDDFDHGTASILELRYHDTQRIRDDFQVGYEVKSGHLTEGDLTPRRAGIQHTLTVKIPERSAEDLERRALFFAVKARDEMGNSGDISNLATAYFPSQKYLRNIKEEQMINAFSGLVVLVVLGVTVVIIVIFVFIVKLLHARDRKKRERSQELMEAGNRIPWTFENNYHQS